MARGLAASVVVLALGAAQPHLVVTRVDVARHGDALRVVAVVANRGAATAPRTSVSFSLGGTRLATSRVRPLAPRAAARLATTLAVPRALAAGAYRLRVCVRAAGRSNCRASARVLRLGDRSAPAFAGLVKAVTCLPGPAGGSLRSSRYTLQWVAATDDTTPARRLVYDIYQAITAGGEDLGKPTYTSEPGATSFSTPPLPDDASYYFVVRARDEAGNRDANRVERLGMNLCV